MIVELHGDLSCCASFLSKTWITRCVVMMKAVSFCASLLLALPMAAAEKGTSTAQGASQQMATASSDTECPQGGNSCGYHLQRNWCWCIQLSVPMRSPLGSIIRAACTSILDPSLGGLSFRSDVSQVTKLLSWSLFTTPL